MKHYYSIANFAVGALTNGYNYLFSTYHNETNQQLFGQLTTYLKGYKAEQTLSDLINGIRPADFPYQWDAQTMQRIGDELMHVLQGLEHYDNWNGEARSVINNTTAFQLISDWSTTTTITAGVLDAIDYYTNYHFSSWSSPIGLPNIIMQNVKQSYETFSLQDVLAGAGAGAGVGLAGTAVGIGIGIGNGIELGVAAGLMIELGALGYACEIFMDSMLDIKRISSLNLQDALSILEKYGIESIKPLNEAGAKFSDLHSWYIELLVEKYGLEIKDKLLHPENIQNEIISADIYIENLTDNGLDQAEGAGVLANNFTEMESDNVTALDTNISEAIYGD
jgi:hypothetical protein